MRKKVIAFIQARTDSTRLPNKVLKKILDKPMILHMLNRVSRSKYIDDLLLLTSNERSDNTLAQIVMQNHFSVFRGSKNNVLKRFYEAALDMKLCDDDIILRLTGDCPVHDSSIIDELIEIFLEHDNDYMSNCLPPIYPDGLDVEIFTFKTLELTYFGATTNYEKEHVTPYIKNNKIFKCQGLEKKSKHSEVRLTVDNIEDFILIEKIYNHFQSDFFTYDEMIKYVTNNTELLNINKHIIRNEGTLFQGEDKLITNFEKSNHLRKRASKLIPGGAHTYSKGDDIFPQLSPHSIVKGKGARIWDVDGNEYIDWGMGLTSVLLGHAYEPVLEVIRKELENGVNFIRPSFIEAEVAEEVCDQIPSAEMVKFSKNGSNVTTAAIKLSRAYTRKNIILRCQDNPFFSVDDWFIGDTDADSGIPSVIKNLTKRFKYNDIEDLKRVISLYKEEGIACVILEAASTTLPKEGYLKSVRELCTQSDIILIFDEVISGFRFHPKGAQHLYGVTPDLSTFGKGMGNGFSIAALVGKKEIMELGGIEHKKERVFLLSTTYGGETHHLRAAQKVMAILNENDYEVTKHIWGIGKKIKDAYNSLAVTYGLQNYTSIEGIECRPYFIFKDENGKPWPILRTLFSQEMIKRGILLQSIVPSFSHGDSEVTQTLDAFDKTLKILSFAIKNNKVLELLVGPATKVVFRKYN